MAHEAKDTGNRTPAGSRELRRACRQSRGRFPANAPFGKLPLSPPLLRHNAHYLFDIANEVTSLRIPFHAVKTYELDMETAHGQSMLGLPYSGLLIESLVLTCILPP